MFFFMYLKDLLLLEGNLAHWTLVWLLRAVCQEVSLQKFKKQLLSITITNVYNCIQLYNCGLYDYLNKQFKNKGEPSCSTVYGLDRSTQGRSGCSSRPPSPSWPPSEHVLSSPSFANV